MAFKKLEDLMQALANRLAIAERRTVPTGALSGYAGSTAPAGWLLCQGQAVSRADYADLFDLLGTTYGAGNGSTTFNLPDLRGRAPVGLSTDAEFNTLGKSGGAKTHTLSVAEMPSHGHTTDSAGDHNHVLSLVVGANPAGTGVSFMYNNPSGGSRTTTNGAHTHSISNTGGSSAHNNLQPYLTLNFIIRT